MITKLSFFFLFMLGTLLFKINVCYSQTTPMVTSTHGYRITITGESWVNANLPYTSLVVNFTLQHADGTPVSFLWPDGAIKVFGWTEENFDASISHSTDASYDTLSQVWRADIPGLDAHDKIAHIEFDIRDPKTTEWQTTNLTSDFQFDNVPIPVQADSPEQVNETFTTNWGTAVTLKGLTLTSKGDNGPQSRFDFVVDHSRVPDDAVQVEFQKGLNNGVAIDGLWQQYNEPSTSAFITAVSSAIAPGSMKTASFEFTIQENAASLVKSIVWTPLQVEITLKGLTPPTSGSGVGDHSSATIDTVHYTLEHIKNNQPWSDSYLIWTQFPDGSKPFQIKSAEWTAISGAQEWQIQPLSITKTVYWHADGTLINPNEHGAFIQTNGRRANFPLKLTVEQVMHSQQILAFHNIPVPLSGQTLLLRRTSDTSPGVPLRLKSISLNKPMSQPNDQRAPDPGKAYTLELTFQYVDNDNSEMALAVIAARDDANNAIDQSLLSNNEGTTDPASVDPNQRIFTVGVPFPPNGSKTINLKTILTEDTPVGPSKTIAVDNSGKWKTVPDFTPPPPTATAAPVIAPQPPGVPPAAAPPAPITSSAGHTYVITVSNLKWERIGNNAAPNVTLGFDFALARQDGATVKFARTAGAITVSGWADVEFDNSVLRSASAYSADGGQNWHVDLPGIDPRDKLAHLEFDIRDPGASESQRTSLTSNIRFNSVPIPAKMNETEKVADTFITDWGTVFTLSGITLDSQSQYGQQTTRFDFSVDHSKVQDDALQLQFQKGFDNGVAMDDMYSMNGGQYSTGPTLTAATRIINPGSHNSMSFEFSLIESAYSPIKSLSWSPVTLDIPLTGLPTPAPQTGGSDLTSKTVSNIEYRFEKMKSPQAYNPDSYVIWTQCPATGKVCRVTRADWSIDPSPYRGYTPPTVVQNGVYWHSDGTPLAAGEYGALLTQDNNNGAEFPLTFTTQVTTHDQQLASFSKIPIPAEGKTIVLDQKPDNPTRIPVRLRAISWKPSNVNQGYQPVPHTLTLTFEYDELDSAFVSIGVLTAKDDAGNSVNDEQDPDDQNGSPMSAVDPDMQTVVQDISIPPTGSKTIELQTILTKDTPEGQPTTFQIDKDGAWTVLGAPN